ncbi:MAG: carboxypeptidase-like regulatory domain-containing protein [Planctomycetota bacterium]|nr:carboxypeptidase-like regulatory domain-containing protein [Planctomycetota bacterium]
MRTLGALVIVALVSVGLWQILSDPPHEDAPARPATNGEREDPADLRNPAAVADAPVASDRFTRRSDPPPEVPAPLQVTVLVEAADGVAVPGAMVVLAEDAPASASGRDEGTLFPEGVTDGLGRVTLDAPLQVVWAVVVKDAYPPVLAAIADAGVTVVRLPGGVSVEGVVTVGGRSVKQPVALELRGYRDVSVDWTLPQRAARARAGYVRGDVIPLVTDDRGRFAFHGLEAETELSLHFPFHQVVGGPGNGGHSYQVIAPTSGVRIDLAPSPGITGRPVGHDGILAVRAVVTPSNGEPWTARPRRGEGGSFHLVLRDGEARQAEVLITRPDGSRFARRLVVSGLDGLVDLGDIPADPLRLLPVHVTGPKGDIAGARVVAGGYVSAPTGEDGWVDFRAPLGAPILVVGAAGYRLEEVRVPPLDSGAVEVRLAPSNALRCVVVGAGAASPGLQVEIAYPGSSLFEGPMIPLHASTDVRGTSPLRRSHDPVTGGGRVIYRLSAGSPSKGVVAHGVRPDTPLTVSLKDAHGHELFKEVVSLGAGQQRTVTWSVERRARALHLRVRDDRGAPLSGVDIELGGRGSAVKTDGEGRAVVEGIFGDRVEVMVSKRGYGTVTVGEVGLEEEVAIRLSPARSVWVTVVDGSGALVDGASVNLDDGSGGRGLRVGPGLYRIDGVPRRRCVVAARAAGRIGTEDVLADVERVRVVLR